LQPINVIKTNVIATDTSMITAAMTTRLKSLTSLWN